MYNTTAEDLIKRGYSLQLESLTNEQRAELLLDPQMVFIGSVWEYIPFPGGYFKWDGTILHRVLIHDKAPSHYGNAFSLY